MLRKVIRDHAFTGPLRCRACIGFGPDTHQTLLIRGTRFGSLCRPTERQRTQGRAFGLRRPWARLSSAPHGLKGGSEEAERPVVASPHSRSAQGRERQEPKVLPAARVFRSPRSRNGSNVCCFSWLSRTPERLSFLLLAEHDSLSHRTASRSAPKTWKRFARHQ